MNDFEYESCDKRSMARPNKFNEHIVGPCFDERKKKYCA